MLIFYHILRYTLYNICRKGKEDDRYFLKIDRCDRYFVQYQQSKNKFSQTLFIVMLVEKSLSYLKQNSQGTLLANWDISLMLTNWDVSSIPKINTYNFFHMIYFVIVILKRTNPVFTKMIYCKTIRLATKKTFSPLVRKLIFFWSMT